jgi:hypothetical protein
MLIVLLISQLGFAAGCEHFGVITGTGAIITQNYDLSGFSRIEVSSAFEATITPSDTYSISITAYENLFDYFEVNKTSDTLRIRMKPGGFTTSNPKVVITLPVLTYLSLSGASHGSARGFVSKADTTLEVSGASSLDVVIATGKSYVDVSGASKLSGSLTTTDSRMEISGASRADLKGFAQIMDISISGASTGDMFDFTAQDVKTDISGASTLNLTVKGKLDAQASGASTINYKGTPTFGKTDVTGASSLNKK